MSDNAGITRRALLAGAAGAGVLAPMAGADVGPMAGEVPPPPSPGRAVLLRGGMVLTLDPAQGDYPRADVRLEGSRIVDIAPRIEAGDATVVDVGGCLVIPGFVDTHRHMWQGQLRNLLPDAVLGEYVQRILQEARPAYTPEDVFLGTRLSALGALNAGITTVLDWSHVGTSPAHADAGVAALRDSGIRAIYAYGSGAPGPENAWPGDLARLYREQHRGAEDRLGFALAAGLDPAPWAHARELGLPVSIHVNSTDALLPVAEHLDSQMIYVHGCRLSKAEWRLIADTGGGLSIAGPIEMQMGHGIPPYQQAIDHGVALSLGNDVETSTSGEFFTQMRTAFAVQRMLAQTAAAEGASAPALLGVREILAIATRGGAEVLGLADAVGTLAPGQRADIVVLDPGLLNVAPLNDAYGAVVTAMETANVRDVFVDGQALKWRGRLVGVDLGALQTALARSRASIVRAAGWSGDPLAPFSR